MSLDARILTALPSHPKTKKLIRRVGEAGAWALVCLFLWARGNRSDGDLSGMTVEDIELAVDWRGDPDAFVLAALAVGFMEGEEGSYRIHDWAEHNPWANGAEARSLKGRWNAIKKHHGEAEADRQVPEWARIRHAGSSATSTKSDATSTAPSTPLAPKTDAPLPSPYPYPSPTAKTESTASSSTASSDPPPAPAKPVPKNPADLAERRAERLAAVTDAAVEAYNRILGKPNGRLAAVRAGVGKKTRQTEVQRMLQVASEICQDQFGSKHVTPAFWEAHFGACSDDPFTNGTGPYGDKHPNWRPDFEYLTRPKTVLKMFDRALDADDDAGGPEAASR